MNNKHKYYCRYKKELTGKGRKRAFIEFSTTQKLIDDPNCITPLPMYIWNDNHPEMTYGILRDGMPEAEIYLLPNNDDGLKYARDNGITIINASINNILSNDELEMEIARDILFVVAAGNHGRDEDHFETISARNPWTIGTGAVEYWGKGNPKIASYSSWGLDKVFNCGMTFLSYDKENPRQKFSGTSASAPWNTVLYSQMEESFENRWSVCPPPEVIKELAIEYSYDLGDLGFDANYGHGVLRLPREFDFEKYSKNVMQLYNIAPDHDGARTDAVLLGKICDLLDLKYKTAMLVDGKNKILIVEKDSGLPVCELLEAKEYYATVISPRLVKDDEMVRPMMSAFEKDWLVDVEVMCNIFGLGCRNDKKGNVFIYKRD